MARTAKTTRSAKPAARGRKPGRPASVATTAAPRGRPPAKPAPSRAAPRRTPGAGAAATPKLSKDELRARAEKLERANAALRTKQRESNRSLKEAAARVAELEDQVARLERRLEAQAKPRKATASRRRVQAREIDPGDAVPPGVAVEEPEPLDNEAELARENLEQHLGEE